MSISADGYEDLRAAIVNGELLPGERLEFSAEYPGELPAGKYRALCSFQFEGKTQTTEAAFEVPKK